VQDTGPGFHAGPGAPLVGALEEATEETHPVEQNAKGKEEPQGGAKTAPPPPRSPDPRPVHQERGEGIGLSIVKRLSELLEASVELESKPGEGTTFRVILPRRYQSSDYCPLVPGLTPPSPPEEGGADRWRDHRW
jgi:hypothetical protein